MMAMKAYEQAAEMLRNDPAADFVGPRDEVLISEAEQRIGYCFPPTYRRFLAEFGCGNIGSEEIYGVVDDLDQGPIPNAVWLNLQRRTRGWNPSFFVFHEAGDGTSHAMDLSRPRQDNETSVWLLDVTGEALGEIESDFGSFLLRLVQEL